MSFRQPRVLVIRRRYLGDIVLLGPVFRNLRLHWPDARITALIEPAYAGVLAMNPDVDAVITLPRSLGEWLRFPDAIRTGQFTHVLDFDNTEKTAAITRFSGAAVRVACNRELIKFRWPPLYTHVANVRNEFYDTHPITETYLQLLAPIGVPLESREVRLVPLADDLAAARELLPADIRAGQAVLLIHPGSRSEFRLWPADRFAAVIDRAQKELGTGAVLIAGPGEQKLVAEIIAYCARKPAVIDQTLAIPLLGALMSLFPVMLCHDSGPMHLANAVGARVVALCGSQNTVIWRPPGDRNIVLQTPLPCSCLPDAPGPCVKHDSYRSYCVRKITVNEVLAAVAKALRA